ncbi:hypothetical protein PISMIDRAFT_94021, partial [Pisolithus microcarpus 441]
PGADDSELAKAREFVEVRTCAVWRNGVFAADGSAVKLMTKPSLYGETFYDRKCNYSLNCQLVVMPHNLQIVDYGLGHPGSVHDAYTFQATRLAREHEEILPVEHWVWADSAYPLEPWCLSPFKRLRGGRLSRPQSIYNRYLSKVCHLFQSLQELRLQIRSKHDLYVAIYWVECCLILHNMIVHFEGGNGDEGLTMGWALHEGLEFKRQHENVVVSEVEGSPGQRRRTALMRDLLTVRSR